ERTAEEREADTNFSGDSGPGRHLWKGNTDRLKNGCECFRPLLPFRNAMGEKSKANHQPKGDWGKALQCGTRPDVVPGECVPPRVGMRSVHLARVRSRLGPEANDVPHRLPFSHSAGYPT